MPSDRKPICIMTRENDWDPFWIKAQQYGYAIGDINRNGLMRCMLAELIEGDDATFLSYLKDFSRKPEDRPMPTQAKSLKTKEAPAKVIPSVLGLPQDKVAEPKPATLLLPPPPKKGGAPTSVPPVLNLLLNVPAATPAPEKKKSVKVKNPATLAWKGKAKA